MKLAEYIFFLGIGIIGLMLPKYLPIILRWIYTIFNYEKILKTFVCEEYNTDHRFIEVKRVDSERITGEELPYDLYVGIEPILMDVKNFPVPAIRKLGYIKVFFHRFGEPFVRNRPSVGDYLNEDKINNTLIERGKYQIIKKSEKDLSIQQKQEKIMDGWKLYITNDNLSPEDKERIIIHPKTNEQILPCKISKIDFLRDDYGTITLSNMYAKFAKASMGGWSFHSLTMIIVYAFILCATFMFFLFDGLDFILAVMKTIVEIEL